MKIALKKIKAIDALIIQNEILKYLNLKYSQINYKEYEKYCEDLIAIELLEEIFKIFRSKIETKKTVFNLYFKISQSVILQYCCRNELIQRNEETTILMQKISSELNEKHINI